MFTIQWVETNKYSMGHYDALITVPFHDTKRVNLFIWDKDNYDLALEKAKEYEDMFMARSTLVW